MKYIPVSILGFCVMALLACQTDDDNQSVIPVEEPIEISKLFNLDSGRYWIYKWVSVDTNGIEESLSEIDTVRIIKDTLIGSRTYIIRERDMFRSRTKELLFDSANSLFTYPERGLIFSLDTSFTTTVEDIASTTTYSLLSEQFNVTVPAGEFECYNFQGDFQSKWENYPFGERNIDYLYAEGVGLVLNRTFLYSNIESWERRLIETNKF